ncbi:thioredoxin family protein [Alicyclobacillus mengziensis]|uniref:Thioredoxin family protein n=1 Tax=Alicyclobacillus mengziensis TaxID=2931921 RepID=A0A9X7W3S7_9BACL|nr:thioredoxin family protein [Alicyclobacillus mengziensis]
MISEQNRTAIRERFAELKQPVVLQYFESNLDCPLCGDVKQLLTELTELTPLLTVEVFNVYADESAAKSLKVDKAPTIVLTDDTHKDFGIRFYGAPSGYEFATLLEDILMMSARDSGLSANTRSKLATLTNAVDLKVFVTPTCPYCPAAVRLAHQFAYESTWVHGAMVEATEFPEWANKFQVYGVPKTIMNDIESQSVEGAVPEQMLLDEVMKVAS